MLASTRSKVSGRALDGAQHIERHDVAGALPDGVDRRLAIEQREAALLDVAVAAEALHRLVDQRRRDLAHPILGDRRHQPATGRRVRIVVARSKAAASRNDERGGRLDVERHVGQHLGHQRLVDELLLEHGAVARVMDGVRASASRISPAEATAQSSRVQRHHLDDGGDAAALLADEPADARLELDLGGGVRAVAELVLEPLEPQPVDAPSGRKRGIRKQESPPGACASTRKASHMGADMNHLWPVMR